MKATIAGILALLLPVTAAAVPATGTPVVYHSPNDNGARPPISPYPIPAANDRHLYLYVDYDSAANGSQTGTMCVSADGDETCAFDVTIVMTAGGTATFDTFTAHVPPSPGTIVGHIETPARRTLRINGIKTNGMARPARIGRLTVDALGATQPFEIKVVGVHRVGAAGQLDAIQPQMIVPEPSHAALLGSGIAALTALYQLRRRLRRGAT